MSFPDLSAHDCAWSGLLGKIAALSTREADHSYRTIGDSFPASVGLPDRRKGRSQGHSRRTRPRSHRCWRPAIARDFWQSCLASRSVADCRRSPPMSRVCSSAKPARRWQKPAALQRVEIGMRDYGVRVVVSRCVRFSHDDQRIDEQSDLPPLCISGRLDAPRMLRQAGKRLLEARTTWTGDEDDVRMAGGEIYPCRRAGRRHDEGTAVPWFWRDVGVVGRPDSASAENGSSPSQSSSSAVRNSAASC